MKENTLNKLIMQQKSTLGQLKWEKRIAQDKMSDPKTLNTIEKKITIKKEEIETLEDISDFAKDTGSYNQGYKFNLVKFINTSNLSQDKLNILRRLKMRLDEEESVQENPGEAFSSSIQITERNEDKLEKGESDNKDKPEVELPSDSSN